MAKGPDITIMVNGVQVHCSPSRDESLLNALRRHGFRSVKMGCNTGDCGDQ